MGFNEVLRTPIKQRANRLSSTWKKLHKKCFPIVVSYNSTLYQIFPISGVCPTRTSTLPSAPSTAATLTTWKSSSTTAWGSGTSRPPREGTISIWIRLQWFQTAHLRRHVWRKNMMKLISITFWKMIGWVVLHGFCYCRFFQRKRLNWAYTVDAWKFWGIWICIPVYDIMDPSLIFPALPGRPSIFNTKTKTGCWLLSPVPTTRGICHAFNGPIGINPSPFVHSGVRTGLSGRTGNTARFDTQFSGLEVLTPVVNSV